MFVVIDETYTTHDLYGKENVVAERRPRAHNSWNYVTHGVMSLRRFSNFAILENFCKRFLRI